MDADESVKEGKPPSLQTLREGMAGRLEEHKLPTLLRHLKASDDLPKTHSGKVDLRKASSVYFPQSVEGDLGDLPDEVGLEIAVGMVWFGIVSILEMLGCNQSRVPSIGIVE